MVWLVAAILPIPGVPLFAPPYVRAQDYPDSEGLPEMTLPDMSADPGATTRGRARSKGTTKRGRAADKTAKKGMTKDSAKTPKAADPSQQTFANTIAPIFVANCSGCHSGEGQGVRRGKLELTSFDKLTKGTPDHKVIEPGKPDDSALVLRIRGDQTPQMPPGQNKLSKEAIAKIEQWVKAGAKLDAGLDPKAEFKTYAATPDQLRKADLAKLPTNVRDQKTEAAGRDRWKQANAKLTEVIPSDHFMIFTSIPKERAASTVKSMEPQYNHLRRFLGEAAMDWPEKLSLYVFPNIKEFTEFVRTVEARDLDVDSQSTVKLAIEHPYIAVVDPTGGKKEEPPRRKSRSKKGDDATSGGNDRSLQGILTETLGAACMGLSGDAPRWLREGIGTYLASQIPSERNSPYYARLRRIALEKLEQGWETKASEALGDGRQMASDEFRAVSFAIVEALNSPEYRDQFPAFVSGMFEGAGKLDDVLRLVYNGTRENFLELTKVWVAHYGNIE